jgi:hypothetical protein
MGKVEIKRRVVKRERYKDRKRKIDKSFVDREERKPTTVTANFLWT